MTHDHEAPLTAAEGHAETALHYAAWSGDLAEVKRLIEAGTDPDILDSTGETALFGAAAGAKIEVVAYLLSVGARHDLHENMHGLTPLHWAASHGGVETLRLFIEAGADPDAEDDHGRLPVDLAHLYGKGEYVAYLKTVGPPIASKRPPR
jgi:ankyrin repeat protein